MLPDATKGLQSLAPDMAIAAHTPQVPPSPVPGTIPVLQAPLNPTQVAAMISLPGPAVPPIVTGSKTLTFMYEKPCKHSMRYKAMGEDPCIETIYVLRTAFNPMPTQLLVTVSAVVKG